jgi:hypothetical protein
MFIVKALVTAVCKIKEKVISVHKVAIQHAEDSTGGAGEARLHKIALKVHGVTMLALGTRLYGEE